MPKTHFYRDFMCHLNSHICKIRKKSYILRLVRGQPLKPCNYVAIPTNYENNSQLKTQEQLASDPHSQKLQFQKLLGLKRRIRQNKPFFFFGDKNIISCLKMDSRAKYKAKSPYISNSNGV